MVANIAEIMERDFIGGIKRKMDGVYAGVRSAGAQNAMGGGGGGGAGGGGVGKGAEAERLEREMRGTFVVGLGCFGFIFGWRNEVGRKGRREMAKKRERDPSRPKADSFFFFVASSPPARSTPTTSTFPPNTWNVSSKRFSEATLSLNPSSTRKSTLPGTRSSPSSRWLGSVGPSSRYVHLPFIFLSPSPSFLPFSLIPNANLLFLSFLSSFSVCSFSDWNRSTLQSTRPTSASTFPRGLLQGSHLHARRGGVRGG